MTTDPNSGSPKPPINFLRGWPAPSLLPPHLIKKAANAVLSDPTISTDGLSYGPDPGYEPLRESMAKWLTSFYQPRQETTASRICITGGASQNLGCILSVFTDPSYTRKIWIVAPAYFLAFGIFEDAGFDGKMRAVPEDEQGLEIGLLRREMAKSEEEAKKNGVSKPRYKPERKRAKVYKHIIYCVPTFANPSSRTMTLDRRRELVRVAREFDALVVCDDVYDFLQWPADTKSEGLEQRLSAMKTAHLPRLVDIDRELDGGAEREGGDGFGNTCSNGTFSKIAGPGIRVGWVEGTEKFAYGVSQTGTTCSGGPPSQLTSTYIHHLIANGELEAHIQSTLRPAYASRYHTLITAIETHLIPLGFQLPQTDREVVGGYFTWLSLPSGVKAEALARRCRHEEKVVVASGRIFEVPGDGEVAFEGFVRLCWAWEEEWNLEEGVRRIAGVVKRMVDEGEGETGGYVVVEKEGDGVSDFK